MGLFGARQMFDESRIPSCVASDCGVVAGVSRVKASSFHGPFDP